MQSSASTQLSIVTACKNGLDFLKQTVNSIQQQTYQNFEWIIVDDASTEPVTEYLNSLKDKRIKVVQLTEAQGQTRALNHAIKMAQSNWIVRMDADDLAHRDRLQKIAEAIIEAEKNQQKLIFSNYQVIDENNQLIADIQYQTPLTSIFYNYLLKRNNPLCHPTVCFSKKYSYDESLVNAQDYALWKKIYRENQNGFYLIRAPLIQYRLAQQSLSGAWIKQQTAELKAIRQNSSTVYNQNSLPLNLQQQQAMYAFRILYYRFLTTTPQQLTSQDFKLLQQSFYYFRYGAKALFYFLFRAIAKPLKKYLLGNIYT